ncbi:MAG TPA: hypothetical protein ENF73_00335 [Proteobacteria bacterium]|nr:hypothetical protein [Pseudomonadota bacterium]
MSDAKGSVNIDEWLRIARTDWERIKRNLADRYPGFGDLGVSAKDMENDIAEARNFVKALFPEEKL